ncbi:MAG: two-component regulator propeller domain-containing protein, partial [Saprospiraceae bacterium]
MVYTKSYIIAGRTLISFLIHFHAFSPFALFSKAIRKLLYFGLVHIRLPAISLFFFRPLLILVCIGSSITGNISVAQILHPVFEHLTTEHGLSSNKVTSVIQDRDGFYWISTQNGLNRFDGTSFKIFRNDPGDSTSLTHNSCSSILEATNGDIWVSTHMGISRYLKGKGIFQRVYLHHPDHKFDNANRVFGLVPDQEGNIWIYGYGLWKYDIKSEEIYLFQKDVTNPASISDNGMVTELVFDKVNNGLWFTTDNELNFYSISENQFYHSAYNPLSWKIFDIAFAGELAIDGLSRLWCRDKYSQELIYFSSAKNTITRTGKKINYGVRRITTDDQNRVWLLYWWAPSEIYDPDSGLINNDFFSFQHDRSILSEIANGLFVDEEKNYWISSSEGVSIYNSTDQYYKVRQLHVDERGTENESFIISAITQTDPGHLWLATNVGLFNYNLLTETYAKVKLTPSPGRVSSMCAVGDSLLIGLRGQILLYDTKSDRVVQKFNFDGNVFFLEKGSLTDVWAGIWKGGLYRIDLQSNQINHYQADSSTVHSLRTNSVISAFEDEGHVWIGYNLGKGFSEFDFSAYTFKHYNPVTQYPSDPNAGHITAIEKDTKGLFWFGTYGSGIYSWNPETGIFTSYQQHD